MDTYRLLIGKKLGVALGEAVVVAFLFAASAYASSSSDIALGTKESSFLQEQYKRSKEPLTDTLLSPAPAVTDDNAISVTAPAANELLSIGSQKLPPIKLEASVNRTIGLDEVLGIALSNNLSIKISKENLAASRYLFAASIGRFLPDLSMTYKKQNLYQNGSLLNQIVTRNMTLNYTFFQGGKVFYDARSKFYDAKSSRFSLYATTNDMLLDVYKKYNSILYNQVLLHIRVKSLESSRAALRVNEQLESAGTGTKFAVMQSKTQLALDAQALVSQEVALRKAAIDLSVLLNQELSDNIIPEVQVVSRTYMLDPKTSVNNALQIAMSNRPELEQFDALRRAALANTKKSAAALLPVAQIYLSPNYTGISNSAGQNTSSSSSVNLSTGGSGTTSVGLGSAQGYSYSFGGTLSWTLSGLGVPDSATVLANNAIARRALQQYNQQALNVMQELRKSFLDVQTAEQQIEITNEGVVAAKESLRLAYIRLQVGSGTNLEYIQSQKSYVDALTNQAKSYIEFQNAQAQMLHDMGVISRNSLVRGFKTNDPNRNSG